MIEWVLYIITGLIAITVVGAAGEAGFLNNAFQRGFAGVGTQIVSGNFLLSYTNFESFLRACLEGQVGLTGYFFLLSLGVLIVTWVSNLYDFKQAIL